MSKTFPPPPSAPASVLGALEAQLVKMFRRLNENQKRLYLSLLASVVRDFRRQAPAYRLLGGL
ncbi:hypothetical protein [Pseudoduganella sp. OTU4001]|uniref:hypothetical protein n=1 Tax=Pseudoduganella sp. OTU4001 TaxID=3043854 RepID=UPI00313E8807